MTQSVRAAITLNISKCQNKKAFQQKFGSMFNFEAAFLILKVISKDLNGSNASQSNFMTTLKLII